MNRVPNSLCLQTSSIHAPEIEILSIDAAVAFICVATRHLISVREHDEPLHRFDAPASRYELGSQPVQQFRMGRELALLSKVVRGSDNTAPEVTLPDPIYHDARRQRMVR